MLCDYSIFVVLVYCCYEHFTNFLKKKKEKTGCFTTLRNDIFIIFS